MPLSIGLAPSSERRASLEPWYFYAALAGYVGLTSPLRAWKRRQLERAGRAPALVLTYHRIADDAANSWTCSNDTFRRHLDWLGERFDFVSLAEVQRRVREGNRRACVTLTFDDGYLENCDRALPLLIERRIPVTYFVTFQNVLEGKPFDHDLKMGRSFPVHDVKGLRDLAAAGIDIGCHGRTHRDVATLSDPAEIDSEIVSIRREMQAALGAPIRHYAFPFGERANITAAGLAAARRAGYLGACSDHGGYNMPGDDDFHLLRHPATDDMIRLVNWATFDWRKAAIRREV